MGLLGDIFKGASMKDPVQGTAQVVSCTGYRGRGVMQNCRMQLVVQAEGVPATAVEHSGLVHNQRWPSPGMTLPVTVDRADPQRINIEWDEVSSSRDRAQQTAEGMAAAMRGEGGAPAGGMPPGVNVVNLSGRDLSDLSPEQREKLRALGVQVPAEQGQGGGDEMDERLDKVGKLDELRDKGALTDAEFEQQKKRILGD